jgi:hypothetical protein
MRLRDFTNITLLIQELETYFKSDSKYPGYMN